MCVVDVDVDVVGLSGGNNRQGHPPDQRVWPTPWERKEFGPKRSVTGALVWWLPVGALHGRSFLVLNIIT